MALRCIWRIGNPHDDKKLGYLQKTAQRTVSIETVQNVAQMLGEMHLKNLATKESPKLIQGHWQGHESRRCHTSS